MNNSNNRCTAAVGSVTAAMKAQSALAAASIQSSVIKTPTASSRGCIYGISFPCLYKNHVQEILSAARIAVRQWNI